MTIAKKYRNIDEYAAVGIALAKAGHRNMWDAGDWWNAGGKQFGVTARNRLVTQQGWKGYSRDTLKTYGSIAKRFPKPLRYLNADCAHFQTVAPLSDALALPLLERAIHGRWTINRLRIEKKRATGYRRPLTGGDVVDDLATLIRDGRKFRAILADPPWQIYRTVGKRGASDPYYPPMTMAEIAALPVPKVATDTAFLFLWCPAALLKDALDVMEAWGFAYKTNAIWEKDKEFGTGFYYRMQHEHLMLGVRSKTPGHFRDKAISSVINAPRGEHSEKPPKVHSLIERACAGPYLELFGRRHVLGWTVIGNQLPPLTNEFAAAAD